MIGPVLISNKLYSDVKRCYGITLIMPLPWTLDVLGLPLVVHILFLPVPGLILPFLCLS